MPLGTLLEKEKLAGTRFDLLRQKHVLGPSTGEQKCVPATQGPVIFVVTCDQLRARMSEIPGHRMDSRM